jgi:hypothetical protein
MRVPKSASTKAREHPFLKKSLKPNDFMRERKAKAFEIVSSADKKLLESQADEAMSQRERRIREALKKKPVKVKAEKTFDEMDDIDPDDAFLDPDADYEPEPDPAVKPKKKKKTKDLVKRKELEHHDLEDVPDSEEDVELRQYGLEKEVKKKKKKRGRKSAAEMEEARDDWAPTPKVEPKKSKKLSTSTELVISAGDEATAKGLALSKNSKSILGHDLDRIQDMIELGDHDTASTMIYKRMLQALLETAKNVFENVVQGSGGARGVQAMNMITSSIRDIMIDIQQAQDRGNMGVSLVEKVIMPSFLDIGMMLLKENEKLKQKLRRDLSPELMTRYETILEEYDSKVGDYVQTQFKEVREETRKFLQR